MQHLWKEYGIDDEKFLRLTDDVLWGVLMLPEEKPT